MQLYIETVCGGEHAAGGGCGAPRGFRRVSKEAFEGTSGPISYSAFEHGNDEVEDFREEEGDQIKLVFNACGECFSQD